MPSEPTVKEVMELWGKNKNYPASEEPISDLTDEDDLMKLFDQFSCLKSPMSDWLEPDTTIVNGEASLQGRNATYEVTIQNLNNTSINGHRGNKSVVLRKCFLLTTSKTKIT